MDRLEEAVMKAVTLALLVVVLVSSGGSASRDETRRFAGATQGSISEDLHGSDHGVRARLRLPEPFLDLLRSGVAAHQGHAPIVAQQPPDESNVPPSEKRVPPGDYCKAKGVPIGKNETHAHSCDCTYSCTIDDQGRVTEHEGPTCMTYCHVNGRRCTCHVEDPTPCTKEGNGHWHGSIRNGMIT